LSEAFSLAEVPAEKLEAVLANLAAERERRRIENALAHYRPYPKQAAFHAAGARARERLLCAANQSGKTLAGARETAMHATGRYPDWWQGRRFDKPTVGWVAGTTNETTRDTVQRMLAGRPGQYGTGAIPKDAIVELVPARGIPDLLDSIKVQHESGGVSIIGVKSYQRGREAFQGETLDYVWCDEEPPIDIYLEILTRTNIGSNPVWITFTPILGMSQTVKRFLLEPSPDRGVTVMTIRCRALHARGTRAHRRFISAARTRSPHQRHPDTRQRSRVPGNRGKHHMRAARHSRPLAAHWWNGFRLGSSVCRGRAGVGSRH
jgi:phage terminase large subunit-like protein